MTASAESLSDELPSSWITFPLERGCASPLWEKTEREGNREGGEGKARGDILYWCYHLDYKTTQSIEGSFIYSAFKNTKFTLNGVSIPSLSLYMLNFCTEQIFTIAISP